MPNYRPWVKASLIAAMFVLGFLAVAVIMPMSRICLGRRSQAIEEWIVMQWNATVCQILQLRLQIVGQLDPKAKLIVANHISWLDIIALGSQFPCLFIAKGEVADWPVIGYLAQGIGTLFVKRGDGIQTGATAEMMVWRLRQGRRLLLFPEGTTTRGDSVLRFHSRLFQPAQLASVCVQAVALNYQGESKSEVPFIGEDEFVSHLLNLLRLDSIELNISFCPAIPVGMDRSIMAQTTHKQILDVIKASPSSHSSVASSSKAVSIK
jgi:1-acyl-sn-glycerol-3-phosphate acyltransferase